MRKIKTFVWFWKESKKFTGYNWLKLLAHGIVPCMRFMKLSFGHE
jgi:hypothetical protein